MSLKESEVSFDRTRKTINQLKGNRACFINEVFMVAHVSLTQKKKRFCLKGFPLKNIKTHKLDFERVLVMY